MTPLELAQIHAACFTSPRPWSADEFAGFLSSDRTILCTEADGFALGQQAGPEVELLTICVSRDARRQGRGRQLLTEFLAKCHAVGAEDVFLEVAQDNTNAITLYSSAGFIESGLRKDYYTSANGQKTSCLLMRKSINRP